MSVRSRDRSRSGGKPSLIHQILRVFASGRDGALYTSAISSLNQISTGTTPVTVVTHPVGLQFDQKLGMVLGPELVVNGNPFVDSGWTKIGTATISGGVASIPVSSSIYQGCTTTIGKTYSFLINIATASNVCVVQVGTTAGASNVFSSAAYITTTGQKFVRFVALSTTSYIKVLNDNSASATLVIDLASTKLFEGNHSIQATAAARPTWTNRVNLLTYTEDFSNAAWTKISGGTGSAPTITSGFVDPNGGAGAWRVQANRGAGDTGADYSIIRQIGIAGNLFFKQCWVKSNTGASQIFSFYSSASQNVTATTEWTLVQTPTVVDGLIFDFGNLGVDGGTRSLDILVWHPQLERSSTVTRYQRVTTSTDFDTAGFPYYLSSLGVDDSLTSATGGGGSAGFFWCGVIKPTGGTGTLRTLWADNGTNTGYKVQIDTNNKLSFSAGNNAAFTILASTATVNVGTTYLLTVYDDGTNLSVQINSATAETVARPVVVAGTAGFTRFKDNGAASSFFIGYDYAEIDWKNTAGTAAERAIVQAFVRAEAGL